MNTDISRLPAQGARGLVPRTRGGWAEVRRWLRALRHTPDRILHRRRRQALTQRLRSYGPPRSILFVCFGNICRSPYAALRMEERLPAELREQVRVRSAGFIGAGRPSPDEAVSVAAARGLDLSRHRSMPLTHEEVRQTDLVVVMDPIQQRWLCEGFGRNPRTVVLLGDLDPDPIDTRTVLDPVEKPAEVFEEVYTRIDRCVEALAAAIAATRA